MKTERIAVLATPDFKRFLESEAEHEGISVGELIRIRCGQPTEEERLLRGLAANAQILEKVILADLENARAPRTSLVNALREAAKRCGPPAQSVYLSERARRVADPMAEPRSRLDPGIVHGLEQIEEPGHSDSARLRAWPSMLDYAAGLHQPCAVAYPDDLQHCRALDGWLPITTFQAARVSLNAVD